MRGFIVLCLVAVAIAAPQYSYQPGAVGGATDIGGQGIAGQDLAGSLGASSGNGLLVQQPTIYNKQFFIHSAPEDDAEGDSSNQSSSLNRRNLRVVFIKSPENKGLENAALQLAKSASEDRTAIYVLNKQTDLNELQNKLSQIQDLNAAKPEVHFVKYKTPQEADHAQRTIQSQYDQLSGPSQVSNEGIAPVRSFIGSLGASSPIGSFGSFGAASNNRGGAAGYLPPQFRFRH